jgi:hypothetical protein
MSYLGTGAVVAQAASPFAILTRSAVGTNVQMDQSSQRWVDETTREIESGVAWIHGFIGTTTATGWLSPYGLTTTALTGRSYYGTGWSDASAARAFCDDAFVGWGSNATWQNYPTTLLGSVSVDPIRSRINIVRMRSV